VARNNSRELGPDDLALAHAHAPPQGSRSEATTSAGSTSAPRSLILIIINAVALVMLAFVL
jgi:hypothetical protein